MPGVGCIRAGTRRRRAESAAPLRLPAVHGRGDRAADCLRQCRRPAAGAGRRAQKEIATRLALGAGRIRIDPAAAHRERGARPCRRRCRAARRHLADAPGCAACCRIAIFSCRSTSTSDSTGGCSASPSPSPRRPACCSAWFPHCTRRGPTSMPTLRIRGEPAGAADRACAARWSSPRSRCRSSARRRRALCPDAAECRGHRYRLSNPSAGADRPDRPPQAELRREQAAALFQQQLIERIEARPASTPPDFAVTLPLNDGRWEDAIRRRGDPTRIQTFQNVISPRYFDALSIPLARGPPVSRPRR